MLVFCRFFLQLHIPEIMYVFKCTVIISTQYLLIFNLLFRVTVSTLLSLVSPAYKLFYHFQHVNVKLCLSKYILS